MGKGRKDVGETRIEDEDEKMRMKMKMRMKRRMLRSRRRRKATKTFTEFIFGIVAYQFIHLISAH